MDEIQIFPSYYGAFHCIADRCRHTCCAGWEISVDEESLARYRADGLPNLEEDEDGARFVLTRDERCPYLAENGLCRLILDKGEGYLCQTCRDHPRFRSYWTGVTETGLGLVCEEAARVILSQREPMKLMTEHGEPARVELPEEEAELFSLRQALMEEAAADAPDLMTARLREYFLFRHIPDALYDGRLEARILFARDCAREVERRWHEENAVSLEARAEIARAFSWDVEYDDEVLESRIAAFDEG